MDLFIACQRDATASLIGLLLISEGQRNQYGNDGLSGIMIDRVGKIRCVDSDHSSWLMAVPLTVIHVLKGDPSVNEINIIVDPLACNIRSHFFSFLLEQHASRGY